MANKVLLKKSSVGARVPTTSDVDYGELALNYADGKLYYKTSGNAIDSFPSLTATATLTNKTLTTPVVDRIDWLASGTGAPTFTTRSSGTKLLLYPTLSGSQADYAIGINAGTLWNSIPGYDGGQYFKWYGGTTQVASLSGTGDFTAKSVTSTGNLLSTYSAGDEGGEIFLAKPQTNTSITTGVRIDIYQNRLRFWEDGGTNRGAYIDLTAAGAGVGTNLIATAGGGTVTSITAGTGLTGGTISTSGTIAIDSTVTTLTGTQTLTNKSLTSPTITGTLTAGGSTGTSGYYLQTTGSGVQWAQVSTTIGYNNSTTSSFPSGDYNGTDSYVGHSGDGTDPFGVSLLTIFTCMDPVGSMQTTDLGVLT